MVLHDGEMEHDECKACRVFKCVSSAKSVTEDERYMNVMRLHDELAGVVVDSWSEEGHEAVNAIGRYGQSLFAGLTSDTDRDSDG